MRSGGGCSVQRSVCKTLGVAGWWLMQEARTGACACWLARNDETNGCRCKFQTQGPLLGNRCGVWRELRGRCRCTVCALAHVCRLAVGSWQAGCKGSSCGSGLVFLAGG